MIGRIPVDSAEAAEFREREADDPDQPVLHDPRCRDGWLGDDEHDHPIPCLQSRPHIARWRNRSTP